MAKIIIILVVIAICSTALAKIIRPCALHDYKCIRNNLAANSYCKKTVKGTLPNKYKVKEFRFETPYFNSTFIDRNLIVKNHNECFVSEFYFNTDTDKAVLCIDCPKLGLASDRVLIQHQSKKEDSYYFYHINATYDMVRLTVNLPTWTHMDLCKAHVFTDVVVLPHFHINPKDKKTEKFLTTDLSLLDIYERENFYYRGYPLMRIFVDTIICDYGCRQHFL